MIWLFKSLSLKLFKSRIPISLKKKAILGKDAALSENQVCNSLETAPEVDLCPPHMYAPVYLWTPPMLHLGVSLGTNSLESKNWWCIYIVAVLCMIIKSTKCIKLSLVEFRKKVSFVKLWGKFFFGCFLFCFRSM